MFAAALLFAALSFVESKTLALQIALDREGFSCNAIDGQWGGKSQQALEHYAKVAHPGDTLPPTPEEAFDRYFKSDEGLFKVVRVTQAEIDSIVRIPKDAAAKANLARLGYESVCEMLAERGHLTTNTLKRLNPGIDWSHIVAGTCIVLPNFTEIAEDLASWPRTRKNALHAEATRLEVSLGKFEVRAYSGDRMIACFPCSIAKDKAKRPAAGTLKVATTIAKPNYTYTPDFTPKGKKPKRHVWPEGPNSPIGVAWIGLDLAGYGIHGTPRPETIGSAESHGCFRLANWNAARLYSLCRAGIPIKILP